MVPPGKRAETLSFLQYVRSLDEDDAWYIQDFTWQGLGHQIVPRILEGQAVAVSDGTYKDQNGAAGWVIEGANDKGTNHPTGVNYLVS